MSDLNAPIRLLRAIKVENKALKVTYFIILKEKYIFKSLIMTYCITDRDHCNLSPAMIGHYTNAAEFECADN